MPTKHEPIDDGVLEQVAREIGEAYSGSRLTRIFEQANVEDVIGQGSTKWTRVYESLRTRQQQDGVANAVLKFIQTAANPARFQEGTYPHSRLLDGLNRSLSLSGYKVNENGSIVIVDRATTLTEAERRVESITREMHHRHIHPEVIRCCEREFLQKDLFHGVHEATKSAFGRLRRAVGCDLDGAKLVDHCFGASSGTPRVAINALATESEKSEHTGLASMLKGAYGMWRNPTAHSLRVDMDLVERDVVDALTTLSYIHRRLDDAVSTDNGSKV